MKQSFGIELDPDEVKLLKKYFDCTSDGALRAYIEECVREMITRIKEGKK